MYFKEMGLKIPIQNIINDKYYILCSKCPPPAATHAWSLSSLSNCFINYALVKLVPFLSNPASLIPALKWMVSIKTFCLRQIFCPILSSRITSHFSRTEPQRIGLAKLSNSWKSRRHTSFHQICGHPTAPISTQWTTRSGTYCKNGFTRQAVRMSTSYDAGLLRNGTSLTSA